MMDTTFSRPGRRTFAHKFTLLLWGGMLLAPDDLVEALWLLSMLAEPDGRVHGGTHSDVIIHPTFNV